MIYFKDEKPFAQNWWVSSALHHTSHCSSSNTWADANYAIGKCMAVLVAFAYEKLAEELAQAGTAAGQINLGLNFQV